MLVGAGLAGEQEITLLAISWFQSVCLNFMTPVRRAGRIGLVARTR
jgi:hypothetical protein